MTRTLAHYERLEQIGEGTYGQVYRARCKDTGRIVAMKKMRIHHGGYWGMPLQLIREIKILKRLHHPRLLSMIEVVTSKGVEHLDTDDPPLKSIGDQPSDKASDAREAYKGNLFLVLEYVEHDLTGLLDVAYQFEEVQIKSVFKQLLEALAFMHENKYVHRDIKSSNILLDSCFRLKLADFGLARCIEPSILEQMQSNNDRSSSVSCSNDLTNKVITLWYRPPEILLGACQYGPAVDVWSAGCILAELLLGKPLFPGKTELETLNLIIDLLGTPSTETWEFFERMKKGKPLSSQSAPPLDLPSIRQDTPTTASRLRDKYHAKVSTPALNLLEKLLEWDPRKRLTAANALQHSYFWKAPAAPEDPTELGRLEVGPMGHFHEFQTKKKRKEAKVAAEQARSQARTGGATEEEADDEYDKVYLSIMKKVAQDGIPIELPPPQQQQAVTAPAQTATQLTATAVIPGPDAPQLEHQQLPQPRSEASDGVPPFPLDEGGEAGTSHGGRSRSGSRSRRDGRSAERSGRSENRRRERDRDREDRRDRRDRDREGRRDRDRGDRESGRRERRRSREGDDRKEKDGRPDRKEKEEHSDRRKREDEQHRPQQEIDPPPIPQAKDDNDVAMKELATGGQERIDKVDGDVIVRRGDNDSNLQGKPAVTKQENEGGSIDVQTQAKALEETKQHHENEPKKEKINREIKGDGSSSLGVSDKKESRIDDARDNSQNQNSDPQTKDESDQKINPLRMEDGSGHRVKDDREKEVNDHVSSSKDNLRVKEHPDQTRSVKDGYGDYRSRERGEQRDRENRSSRHEDRFRDDHEQRFKQETDDRGRYRDRDEYSHKRRRREDELVDRDRKRRGMDRATMDDGDVPLDREPRSVQKNEKITGEHPQQSRDTKVGVENREESPKRQSVHQDRPSDDVVASKQDQKQGSTLENAKLETDGSGDDGSVGKARNERGDRSNEGRRSSDRDRRERSSRGEERERSSRRDDDRDHRRRSRGDRHRSDRDRRGGEKRSDRGSRGDREDEEDRERYRSSRSRREDSRRRSRSYDRDVDDRDWRDRRPRDARDGPDAPRNYYSRDSGFPDERSYRGDARGPPPPYPDGGRPGDVSGRNMGPSRGAGGRPGRDDVPPPRPYNRGDSGPPVRDRDDREQRDRPPAGRDRTRPPREEGFPGVFPPPPHSRSDNRPPDDYHYGGGGRPSDGPGRRDSNMGPPRDGRPGRDDGPPPRGGGGDFTSRDPDGPRYRGGDGAPGRRSPPREGGRRGPPPPMDGRFDNTAPRQPRGDRENHFNNRPPPSSQSSREEGRQPNDGRDRGDRRGDKYASSRRQPGRGDFGQR
ncbi:hypothetical protein ACA910_004966 [Epithemia clementina (nom. ined.)]